MSISSLPLHVFLVPKPSLWGSEFVERRRTTRLSCHTTAVTSSCCIFLDSPLFNFKTVGFLNSVGQFFLFALVSATAVRFLFQQHFHKICGAEKIVGTNMMPFCPEIFCKFQYNLFPQQKVLLSNFYFSSNTWKISASSALLREARDVDAIISTSIEPSGRD